MTGKLQNLMTIRIVIAYHQILLESIISQVINAIDAQAVQKELNSSSKRQMVEQDNNLGA